MKVLFYTYHVKFEQVSRFLPSLGKKSKTLSPKKKEVPKLIRNVYKVFWPKILITNTLNINVHKMYECDKNQVPYCIAKRFKN